MALSDRRILEEMKRGDIIISPFKRSNLGTSSYDVTLGENYFREHPTKHAHNIFNIYKESHIRHVWGEPMKAEPAKKVFQAYNFSLQDGIKPRDKVILLYPGETILAHTNEFIGGKDHITTMMKARSTLGRLFIEVCKCAGWGDVGYINRWTMEITNNSQNYVIPLVVGRRIAQMIFFETGQILDSDKDYTKTGKYCTINDLPMLKKRWSPEEMIPKLWKDRDLKK